MRAVVDTNVLVQGINHRGACGRIIDHWVERSFVPCVSTALALEYEAVLLRHVSVSRRTLVLGALQALLSRVEFIPIVFSYRPHSPDPNDDFIIECAMNGKAIVVTSNIKDFKAAALHLGFTLMTPEDFETALSERTRR